MHLEIPKKFSGFPISMSNDSLDHESLETKLTCDDFLFAVLAGDTDSGANVSDDGWCNLHNNIRIFLNNSVAWSF